MDPIKLFYRYAAEFEKVYATDDWSSLEPFFTEDAVYDIRGTPRFEARHEGREAVFGALKTAIDNMDRRFDKRVLGIIKGPEDRNGAVWFHWKVRYLYGQLPELYLEGEETITFEGSRIVLMEDLYTEEMGDRFEAWWSRHGGALPQKA